MHTHTHTHTHTPCPKENMGSSPTVGETHVTCVELMTVAAVARGATLPSNANTHWYWVPCGILDTDRERDILPS